MSDRNPKKDPRKPRHPVPDFDLWTRLTQTVTPLRKTDKPASAPDEAQEPSQPASPPRQRPRRPATPPPSPQRHQRPGPPPAPPLSGLDRRTGQRLMRGQLEIEARIDLHGETAETARVKLFAFLSRARARGDRFALVITGKGQAPFARHTLHGWESYETPERQGRLRSLVPQWLQESEFRALVSGYQPAHPRHGGGGALYVRLRRARAGDDRR